MTVSYQEINSDSFVPVRPEQLVPEAPLPCDIFMRDRETTISLFNKGNIFDGSARGIIEKKAIVEVYIRAVDAGEFEKYRAAGRARESGPPEAVAFKDYSARKEEYHQIDRSLLVPGTRAVFSLFAQSRYSRRELVAASEAAPATMTEEVLRAPGDLVIRKADIPRYHSYLNAIITGGGASTEQVRFRTIAIRESSKLVLRDLYDNPRSGEKIKESISLVNRMIDGILENSDAIHDLLSLRSHDYYTYTHSVNVAALSVGLAVAAGLERKDVEKLGIGALLHDLGKSVIPHEILNKPARLTDLEFSIMKTHVVESDRLLRDQKDIPAESFIALLQHHEKLSGKGYPNGLSGADVKVFGRITAIADCYDAMTTERPYKPPFTPYHALSLIVGEPANYDAELLKVFIKMLGKIT